MYFAILSFTGSTLKVILHIDTRLSIIISAIIAVCYTLVGGLLSVAYTDVFQIAFIAFGLVCTVLMYFAGNVGFLNVMEEDRVESCNPVHFRCWHSLSRLVTLPWAPSASRRQTGAARLEWKG